METARQHEIANLLLVQQMQQQGVLGHTALKAQLNNATQTLGIPAAEMGEFAVLLAQDVARTLPP